LAKGGKGTNQLRIIGGTWRSRRLQFPDVEGLRPSTDRVRETLFNWLQPTIVGARCLDLFAGSGALGLEALSRGAARVVFVDQHPQVISALRSNLQLLGSEAGSVVKADALSYLQGDPHPFDIVFLDPPFHQQLLQPSLQLLQRGWLAPDALLYIENELPLGTPELPENWRLLRSKKAGQVAYHLVTNGQ
jgi:16S rRNA (guanine966-N2)-methyltransferase